MRKKRLWRFALPALLCGAIFWAREASWSRQETRFHLATHQWLEYAGNTRVYSNSLRLDDPDSLYFEGNSGDSLLAIDGIKVIASLSPCPLKKPLIFISLSDGGSVGEPFGFYLSQSEDRGWIEIPEPDMDAWKNYELALETCRALKRRIYALKKKGGSG